VGRKKTLADECGEHESTGGTEGEHKEDEPTGNAKDEGEPPAAVRASPTMPQTNASNRNIGLYTGKTTPTVPQFNKFCQKTIRHPLKCLKYTTP
jgi:hypothetical protein